MSGRRPMIYVREPAEERQTTVAELCIGGGADEFLTYRLPLSTACRLMDDLTALVAEHLRRLD